MRLLTQQDQSLDLRPFACLNVTVSFAVASLGLSGLSNFSPLVYLSVDVDVSTPSVPQCFPDQLSSIVVTTEPDQRCGFFLRHVLHVSWDQPEGSYACEACNEALAALVYTVIFITWCDNLELFLVIE